MTVSTDSQGTERVPIRFGLIGLGWGAAVAEAIATLPDLSLMSCYARSAEARESFAHRYGCDPCDSYDAMLDDPDIDAVLVMTPNSLHLDHAVRAATRGKHVFVTKPIANTIDAAKAISRACADHGVILAVSHPSRREPGLRRIKQLIDENALGLIGLVEANCATTTGLSVDSSDWRWSEVECPGGPLLQLGIHQIDNLHYLLGPIERVYCNSRLVAGGAVDDVICCLLEFESGLTGTLTCSYVSSESRWIRLYGTEGNAHYDRLSGLTLRRDIWNLGPRRELLCDGASLSAPIPSLIDELAAFADCVRAGRQPEVTGKEGLQALAVVLAAVESSRRGRAVDIQEILLETGETQ